MYVVVSPREVGLTDFQMNSFLSHALPAGAVLVECTCERHGPAILEIFNDAILTSTALYDYKPRTLASMQAWFQAKAAGGFPVVGFENEAGELMGFASYGSFRAYPANKYTVEHSVYVQSRFRGKGLAEALMRIVIDRARQAQLHVLVGGIDATNAGSIRLHEKLGFVHAGTIRHAGFKFGRWLDLAFYQLILDTPVEPVDG
ncbi:GNAT family N-acetyltransferase [Bordetella tumbae]